MRNGTIGWRVGAVLWCWRQELPNFQCMWQVRTQLHQITLWPVRILPSARRFHKALWGSWPRDKPGSPGSPWHRGASWGEWTPYISLQKGIYIYIYIYIANRKSQTQRRWHHKTQLNNHAPRCWRQVRVDWWRRLQRLSRLCVCILNFAQSTCTRQNGVASMGSSIVCLIRMERRRFQEVHRAHSVVVFRKLVVLQIFRASVLVWSLNAISVNKNSQTQRGAQAPAAEPGTDDDTKNADSDDSADAAPQNCWIVRRRLYIYIVNQSWGEKSDWLTDWPTV